MFKKMLLPILFRTGAMNYWMNLNREKVVFLMIHGVMNSKVNSLWKPLRSQLSQEELGFTLSVLLKYFKFISMDNAMEMLSGRADFKPNCIVLTFDDGYRNNITYALPVLKKMNVPATFFLSTGNIEYSRPFWFDRLDYAVQQLKVQNCSVEIKAEKVVLDFNNHATLRKSFKYLLKQLKGESDNKMIEEVERICSTFEKESGQSIYDIFDDDDWSRTMSWDEVKDIAANEASITFGSHTVDHARLDLVSKKSAIVQLSRSKEIIESKTGRVCDYFCYPNGNYSKEVVNLVKGSGYKAALTTDLGLNDLKTNPFTLKRIPYPKGRDCSTILYMASGLSAFFAGLRKIRWNKN